MEVSFPIQFVCQFVADSSKVQASARQFINNKILKNLCVWNGMRGLTDEPAPPRLFHLDFLEM